MHVTLQCTGCKRGGGRQECRRGRLHTLFLPLDILVHRRVCAYLLGTYVLYQLVGGYDDDPVIRSNRDMSAEKMEDESDYAENGAEDRYSAPKPGPASYVS